MLFTTILILSFLPLRVLYLLADLTYVVLYKIVGYRKMVVRENLKKSFPFKNDDEIHKIEKQYYRHLADLLAEGIYNLRASEKKIVKHYRIVNRELADKYYEEGKSIILMSAHYNNWEYMITSLEMQLRHHAIGVGKELKNKSFGLRLDQKRTRFGTEIVTSENVREVMQYYNRYKVPVAYMMLCDQSPNNPKRCYWTKFLGQETAFIYGPEKFARKYNFPVLYYTVKKVKRGYYEVILSELCPEPMNVDQYSIMESYIYRLEKDIKLAPQYWLWSHKRWKYTQTKSHSDNQTDSNR